MQITHPFPNASIRIYQDKKSWLVDRASYITATNADLIVLGKYDAIAKKIGKGAIPQSVFMKLGNAVEPIILDEAKKFVTGEITHGGNVNGFPSMFVSNSHPKAAATLDGWTNDGIVLEAKSVWTPNSWPDLNVCPRAYWLQVQWQLWVTGAKIGLIIALHAHQDSGITFKAYKIGRNEKLHEIFAERLPKAVAAVNGKNVPDDDPAMRLPEVIKHEAMDPPKYPTYVDKGLLPDDQVELVMRYAAISSAMKRGYDVLNEIRDSVADIIREHGGSIVVPLDDRLVQLDLQEYEEPVFNMPENVKRFYMVSTKPRRIISTNVIIAKEEEANEE